MSTGEAGRADVPGPPTVEGAGSASGECCGPGAGPRSWDWPDNAAAFDADVPLQALMFAAAKLLGAYGQCTVAATGLKVSPAGLGVLRVLMGGDGLKASEVADRARATPGTLTAVVNTLVRDGLVERRADAGDRRVVRLYLTGQGREIITHYTAQAAPRWRKAFDFVDSDDEAAVRRFFIQMIDHLSQLMREERGK